MIALPVSPAAQTPSNGCLTSIFSHGFIDAIGGSPCGAVQTRANGCLTSIFSNGFTMAIGRLSSRAETSTTTTAGFAKSSPK